MEPLFVRQKKITDTQIKTWSFCNVYLCIHQQNQFSNKTNTQQTIAKVKNLHTEEKSSFAYLCICVQASKITA
jgi:hypothetical protein